MADDRLRAWEKLFGHALSILDESVAAGAPANVKPTTTNLAVLELGEPEQLVEIQAFAVID
jgi:hypothetical protein